MSRGVEAVKEAINVVFSDRGVGLETALERQEEIRDCAQANVDALKDDIQAQDGDE